jgi:hypothetical protein
MGFPIHRPHGVAVEVFRMISRIGRRLLLQLLAPLLLTGSVWACPNCKEAVSAQPEDMARMASGYNWSVLFMLAVPASLLGTGAFMVHRAVKKGVFPEM